jgi:nucleoside-diphosphate-sugar epimerase
MERNCKHYYEDFGIETRVVRFHNIFGPLGTYDGGREKSPAAICRKVALTANGAEIEVWGDGLQTRSYCYIDDCVEGIYRLMRSNYREPLNLGQDRMVSINQLVDIVSGIAGKTVKRRHDLTKPQGVRGRNSDNTKLRRVLEWEPRVSLEDGLRKTYKWIFEELAKSGRDPI